LLSRNAWSLHWTTLSNNLERNAKLDTGLKLFISPASKPLFFNSGRITACLNSEGKQPETSDALNSRAMKGDSRLRISFTSHVGTGSSWHVLVGAEPISFCGPFCELCYYQLWRCLVCVTCRCSLRTIWHVKVNSFIIVIFVIITTAIGATLSLNLQIYYTSVTSCSPYFCRKFMRSDDRYL